MSNFRSATAQRWAAFIERPHLRALRTRYERQIAWALARLSPREYLGLHLTIGVLVMALAAIGFGAIAEDVATSAPIVAFDLRVADWLHSHASTYVTRILYVVTNIHSPFGIGVLAATLAAYLAHKRWWYWLLALVVTLPGGMLVNTLMKHAFHRVRPHFDDPLLLLETFSFPSGHVAGSTLFYGFVVALVMGRIEGVGSRIGIVMVALMMVALVAMSRMYLGVHYFSDVLGAFAEGLAWLAIGLAGVHAYKQSRTQLPLIAPGSTQQ